MLPGTVRFNYPVLNTKTFLCLTKQINSIVWSGAPFSVQLPDAEIIRPLPVNCQARVSGCREMGSHPFISHTGNQCLTIDSVSMKTSEPVCALSHCSSSITVLLPTLVFSLEFLLKTYLLDLPQLRSRKEAEPASQHPKRKTCLQRFLIICS